jgi:hypothetical protein
MYYFILFLIARVPGKPTNLIVTNITSESAKISWLYPKYHGINGFSRLWIKLKKENSLILNITSGRVNKYEINNLTPHTTYEISVAAGNYYYGFGEESSTSFLTSEEGELLKDLCFSGRQNMVPLYTQHVYFS